MTKQTKQPEKFEPAPKIYHEGPCDGVRRICPLCVARSKESNGSP